jgi:hypothetical protein
MAFTLVCFCFLAAATYGRAVASGGVSTVVSPSPRPGEPAALLVSGGVLLGLAGALRRFNF